MKNEEKRVIFWALASLLIFLFTDAVMTFATSKMSLSDFRQVTLAALALYAATFILAFLHIYFSYYIMAFVVAIYGIGFIGMITKVITSNVAVPLIRVGIGALALLGIVISVYWFIGAWQLRNTLQMERYQKRLKQEQSVKK